MQTTGVVAILNVLSIRIFWEGIRKKRRSPSCYFYYRNFFVAEGIIALVVELSCRRL
jgi:hypothetical protein